MPEIRVNQTLHGYDGGHSLLAASEHLPHSSESELFVLSDLSGSSLVSGFDEYLTGYPLTEISAFAFARTWYADEMERPGCVWTHTLIVQSSDLALLDDCSILLKYFRRPTRDSESWAGYERKLSVIPNGPRVGFQADHSVPADDHIVVEAIRGLYDAPEVPICLPAKTSRSYESLVVALWSQQWPRLRRAFRFCTGAIESRMSKGKPFDFQVIPVQTISRFQRDLPNAIIIGRRTQPEPLPEWIYALVSDLMQFDVGMRLFFRNFGVDIAARRTAMERLCRAYQLLCQEKEIFAERIDRLLELFPSAGEAIRLKMALLTGDESELACNFVNGPSVERIQVLLSTTHDASFPRKMFDSSQLDHLIEREGVFGTLRIVASTPHLNSFGESLVTHLAKNFSPKNIESPDATPAILLLLTSRNPKLATYAELWRSLRDRSHQLIDLLGSAHLTADDWDAVVRATVGAQVPNVAEPLVKSVGSGAIFSVLELLQNSASDIPFDWHQQIERHSAAVAEWLRSRSTIAPSLLKILTEDLNPYDASVVGMGTTIWGPLFTDQHNLALRTAAFLLVLGFQNPAGTPYTMVADTFDIVHRAAAHSSLDQRTWLLLRDIVPSLGFFYDWDVCERLRRVLVSKFITYGWPLHAFLNALQDAEAFDRTLYYLASEKHLRPFGRRLLNEGRSGVLNLTSVQYSLVEKYAKKFKK